MQRRPCRLERRPAYPRWVPASLLAAAGVVAMAPMGLGCRTVGSMVYVGERPSYGEPDPCAELDPQEIDFGTVPVGALPTIEDLVLRNPCWGDLEIYDLGIADEAAPFDIEPLEHVLIPAHWQADLQVRFLAGLAGGWETDLWIETNDPESPVVMTHLLGEVVE